MQQSAPGMGEHAHFDELGNFTFDKEDEMVTSNVALMELMASGGGKEEQSVGKGNPSDMSLPEELEIKVPVPSVPSLPPPPVPAPAFLRNLSLRMEKGKIEQWNVKEAFFNVPLRDGNLPFISQSGGHVSQLSKEKREEQALQSTNLATLKEWAATGWKSKKWAAMNFPEEFVDLEEWAATGEKPKKWAVVDFPGECVDKGPFPSPPPLPDPPPPPVVFPTSEVLDAVEVELGFMQMLVNQIMQGIWEVSGKVKEQRTLQQMRVKAPDIKTKRTRVVGEELEDSALQVAPTGKQQTPGGKPKKTKSKSKKPKVEDLTKGSGKDEDLQAQAENGIYTICIMNPSISAMMT